MSPRAWKILFVAFLCLLAFSVGIHVGQAAVDCANNHVAKYLLEKYGVETIEEYVSKLKQEVWQNYAANVVQPATWDFTFESGKQEILNRYGTSTVKLGFEQTEVYPWQLNFAYVNLMTELSVFSLAGISLLSATFIPFVKNKRRLRNALILAAVSLVVFSIGFFSGRTLAQSAQINRYFETRELPYSYMISTDGTYYYATRYDGYLAFGGPNNRGGVSGTDASAVAQAALNALTPNRTWVETVILKGNFVFYSTLNVSSFTRLVLDGSAVCGTSGINMIQNAHRSDYDTEVWIEGGSWEGDGKAVNIINWLNTNPFPYWLSGVHFRNLDLHGSTEYSIVVKSGNCHFDFENLHCGPFGIFLDNVTDFYMNNCSLGGHPGHPYYSIGAYCAEFGVLTNLYLDGPVYLVARKLVITNVVVDIGWNSDGITFDSSQGNVLSNVYVRIFGDNGYNTKSAVKFVNNYPEGWGNCRDNIILGLIVGRLDDAESNRWKYGVEEDSTADYNLFGFINGRDCVTAALRKLGANSKYVADSIQGAVVTT